MVYIPNPTDASQPTGNVDASTADDEFRALKAYVLGLALTAGMFSPVRQTVNDGFIDASGNPAFLTAAAAGGEALDLKATGRPLVVNFAGGSTGTGVNDRNSTITGDTANIVTALPASNTSYIYADYVNAASMTFGQTLAPVQYGKVYPQNIGSVLQFAGAAGATTFLDDFGNTWTAQGGARVQTNQFKFGTGGLGGQGAANVMNGAADSVRSTAFTSLGAGGWTIRAWAYPTVLPGVGVNAAVITVANATNFGALAYLNNTGGTIRWAFTASSNGVANDIAPGNVGTTLPVINTWYFIELTFDALAGVYRLYVNGVQEATVVSTAKICQTTEARVGAVPNNTAWWNGYIDKPEILSYCQHPAGTTYAVPVAAPNLATAGYAPDAFDIQAMKMYSVTGPSVAAGSAPATTQKYRVYLGEIAAGVAVPTTVTNYAFNGRATPALQACAAGAAGFSFVHNLGLTPQHLEPYLVCFTSEVGYLPGNTLYPVSGDNSTQCWLAVNTTRLQAVFIQTVMPVVANLSTGARAGLTPANFRVGMNISRGWGGA